MENTNQNIFVKLLKMFGTFLKNLVFDFIAGFKYNNMKLPGLLIVIPGLLIGFMLKFHYPVVNTVAFDTIVGMAPDAEGVMQDVSGTYKISFDYTGAIIFALMLLGILNIFTGFQLSGKKNLGSVVLATVVTVLTVVCGVLYFVAVFTYIEGSNKYYEAYLDFAKQNPNYENSMKLIEAAKQDGQPQNVIDALIENQFRTLVGDNVDKLKTPTSGILNTTGKIKFDHNYVLSLGSVLLSMVCSTAGCIIGFIKYDRNYEKVDR